MDDGGEEGFLVATLLEMTDKGFGMDDGEGDGMG